MVRPRWHDVMIVGAIVALLAVGVWALWWDDVRGFLRSRPGEIGLRIGDRESAAGAVWLAPNLTVIAEA